MKTIYDLCQPRQDVLEGRIKDEEFAADLSKVVTGKAVPEYGDPAVFFHYTYPTRGMKTLLESVCRRLSGVGGELNSVIRLDTQYGGGKTHSLIALVHAVQGMKGVANAHDFIAPEYLPKGHVRIAALSGENSDPVNGLKLEDGAMAHSLWGEMAFRLAGRSGFERIRRSDESHIAPGAETIAELFGGEPTLILIDEVSIYLRKAAGTFKEAANQFTAFLQALITAVTSTPRVALVCTLAIGSDDQQAKDAYQSEHLIAVQAFEEAKSVASRKLLQLDPTQEDETVNVIQRRLFESVDLAGAEMVIAGYLDTWNRNKESLSPDAGSPEIREQFKKGYPLHPETLNVMTEKMSSLATFQRTRGMLRLLARTVEYLWKNRPEDAFAIHPHHIDPGYGPIRLEFLTKLGQEAYTPALAADIAAVEGKDRSTAQRLDKDQFAGQPPVASYVARTIFAHTMAYSNAQGIPADHLRYAVCSPAIEPALVESARRSFVQESLYLDDRPGVPLRFQVEPNLNQIINRAMKEVGTTDLRTYLDTKIKDLFKGGKTDFEMVAFPGGPADVPDEISSNRPYLVLLHYDAFPVAESHPSTLHHDLVRMATRKGIAEDMRIFLNNLIFVTADKKLSEAMKLAVRRRLALEAIQGGAQWKDLADHQQKKIKGDYAKSQTEMAVAILQCYRHLFYPSNAPVGDGKAMLGHTAIELHSASDDPGHGQQHIRRALREQKKLLDKGDAPDSPAYVRDQTPLKTKGEMSVFGLLAEYRKAPGLCILMDQTPLIECIRCGIDLEVFIYREGEQLWGKGDPSPGIQISENAFVHTLEDAKKRSIWPRKKKEAEAEPPPASKSGPARPEGGEIKEPPPASKPKPGSFSSEGPLQQALVQIFEDARDKKINRIESMIVRFFEYKGAWTFQQSLGTYRDADITCRFDVNMAGDGIDKFEISFTGALPKAATIRTFIEPQLRTAREHDFNADYTLKFKSPLSTRKEISDAFIEVMTKYGGAESSVEAVPANEKEA